LTNGEFTSATTGWSVDVDSTIAKVDSTADPGTNSGGADVGALKVTAGSTGASSTHATVGSAGGWYKISGKAYAASSNTRVNAARIYGTGGTINPRPAVTAEDAWQTLSAVDRNSAGSFLPYANVSTGGAFTAGDVSYFDSLSVKQLTLSTLFLTAPLSTANVLASVEITKTGGGSDGLQAGLVTNLDSAATPANFVISYLDGASNCKMDKNVAGAYTNLISTATGCTYSAGKAMVVVKDDTAYRLYYNDTFIGTQQTVSDAGIISNTLHGLFSTGGATFDDLVIYSRGTENQYSILEQFIR
jgi:hypothetical protein